MKNILFPLIIFSIIASCANPQMNKTEFENDLQIRGLKGKITSVRTEIFEYKITENSFEIGEKINSYSAIDRDELLEFNDIGNLIKRTEFYSNGKISNQTEYFYNSKHQILKIIETDNYGKGSQSIQESVYDKNDSIKKFTYSSGDFKRISIAERDENNRLITRRDIVNDTVQMTFNYKYDSLGNLIEENAFIKDSIPSKLISRSYEDNLLKTELTETYGRWDTLQEKSIYEYDNHSRIKLIKEDYVDDNNFTLIENFYDENDNLIEYKIEPIGAKRYSILIQKWNEFGNQIEYSRTDGQTGNKEIWISKYEFDQNNNWVLKTHFKNGKPLYIVKRKINYAE
ncbi:hypothetical protein DFR65_1158 [Oceanihabitans sediminis]|nr:hypothetical protein [Oceanihabitans sediminis]RBP26512.1 hypothetical protein DFR65_1158 [Oceanihabitans sediminis]